jgi:uncharacterized membrane protein
VNDLVDPWMIVRTLHVLGAVVWVGGLFFALLIMRPAIADLAAPQRVDVYRAAFHRFLRLLWVVMPLMLGTGYLMLFGKYGGFADGAWNLHLMHMFGLAMSGIFLGLWFGPYQAFQCGQGRAIDLLRPLLFMSLVLGLATVVVATID